MQLACLAQFTQIQEQKQRLGQMPQPRLQEKVKVRRKQLSKSIIEDEKPVKKVIPLEETEGEGESKPPEVKIKKKVKKEKLVLNIKYCEYEVLEKIGVQLGYKISRRLRDPYDIMWVDLTCGLDVLKKLKPWQRVNHFPGMHSLAKKPCLAQNIR